MRDDGRPQLLARIARALEASGTACTRLVREQGGTPPVVYARVLTCNLHAVHEALRAAGLEIVSRKAGGGGP